MMILVGSFATFATGYSTTYMVDFGCDMHVIAIAIVSVILLLRLRIGKTVPGMNYSGFPRFINPSISSLRCLQDSVVYPWSLSNSHHLNRSFFPEDLLLFLGQRTLDIFSITLRISCLNIVRGVYSSQDVKFFCLLNPTVRGIYRPDS